MSTVLVLRMAHRKRKEIKQQPSMLPGQAVPGSCLVSFHFSCFEVRTLPFFLILPDAIADAEALEDDILKLFGAGLHLEHVIVVNQVMRVWRQLFKKRFSRKIDSQ